MVKTAVLVSGGGTNLQALLDAKAAGRMPSAEISLVIANRKDACALHRARNAGVESLWLPKMKAESTEAYGEKLLAALRDHQIAFVVLAGFLMILPENVVRAYENRIINIHPSLIPAFCGPGYYGLKVHQAALDYGVKVTGATVHYVNEIPDGGRIIAQKAVDIHPEDTAETLQKRVMEAAEWVLLPKALEDCACALLKGETL